MKLVAIVDGKEIEFDDPKKVYPPEGKLIGIPTEYRLVAESSEDEKMLRQLNAISCSCAENISIVLTRCEKDSCDFVVSYPIWSSRPVGRPYVD